IVRRTAEVLKVGIDVAGAREVAKRSRGTPRVANRLLRRVRDYAQVRADGVITAPVAQEALRRLEIDTLGCDETDRRILHAIIDKFDGGPVGLDTIAAAISEESDTIMDVYEPYLLQLGFLARTPRGRIATRKGYEHMGVSYPLRIEEVDVEQGKLF
ncbi:MAG: Holliday junction branch migration DNA helicase RuvB, partial [Chloroflexota bacterium]|nr:Holliday junction branch migration DNA helicase RuvB [Chloroflexota bacterium]